MLHVQALMIKGVSADDLRDFEGRSPLLLGKAKEFEAQIYASNQPQPRKAKKLTVFP